MKRKFHFPFLPLDINDKSIDVVAVARENYDTVVDDQYPTNQKSWILRKTIFSFQEITEQLVKNECEFVQHLNSVQECTPEFNYTFIGMTGSIFSSHITSSSLENVNSTRLTFYKKKEFILQFDLGLMSEDEMRMDFLQFLEVSNFDLYDDKKNPSIIEKQLCKAIDTLHRNKIAHLDLKPENVVLHVLRTTDTPHDLIVTRVMLIDFSYAIDISNFEKSENAKQPSSLTNNQKIFRTSTKSDVGRYMIQSFGQLYGTLCYSPPERFYKELVDPFKIDIWSLAFLIAILRFGLSSMQPLYDIFEGPDADEDNTVAENDNNKQQTTMRPLMSHIMQSLLTQREVSEMFRPFYEKCQYTVLQDTLLKSMFSIQPEMRPISSQIFDYFS